MDTSPAPADEIVEPTVTSRRRGSLLLLRTAGWVLAVVVVVMHVFAPAMSAGFPHLSTFGWTLITAGYLTYFDFIFPSTGTGGWEAAVTNTLSPGDNVLAARYGMFSPSLDRPVQAPRFRGRGDRDAVGRGRAGRRHRGGAEGRHIAQDPRGARLPQRDRDRRQERHRRRPPRDRCGRPSGDAVRRRRLVDRLDGFPHGRNGASTSRSPARRRVSCCRRASPSSGSARRRSKRWNPPAAALLLRYRATC